MTRDQKNLELLEGKLRKRILELDRDISRLHLMNRVEQASHLRVAVQHIREAADGIRK